MRIKLLFWEVFCPLHHLDHLDRRSCLDRRGSFRRLGNDNGGAPDRDGGGDQGGAGYDDCLSHLLSPAQELQGAQPRKLPLSGPSSEFSRSCRTFPIISDVQPAQAEHGQCNRAVRVRLIMRMPQSVPQRGLIRQSPAGDQFPTRLTVRLVMVSCRYDTLARGVDCLLFVLPPPRARARESKPPMAHQPFLVLRVNQPEVLDGWTNGRQSWR